MFYSKIDFQMHYEKLDQEKHEEYIASLIQELHTLEIDVYHKVQLLSRYILLVDFFEFGLALCLAIFNAIQIGDPKMSEDQICIVNTVYTLIVSFMTKKQWGAKLRLERSRLAHLYVNAQRLRQWISAEALKDMNEEQETIFIAKCQNRTNKLKTGDATPWFRATSRTSSEKD